MSSLIVRGLILVEALSDATVFPPPPPAGIPLELIVGFNNLTEPLRVELIRPEQPIERTVINRSSQSNSFSFWDA